MYTHTIQHCFPQENLTPFQKPSSQNTKNEPQVRRKKCDSTETKSKPKSRFSTKIRAILKSPTTPRSSRHVKLGAGKKVTWNVNEEQIQPGESHDTGDAWPSPDSEEDQQVNLHPMDHSMGYIMTPDLISDDENLTPTHIHHRREGEIFESIIPIHTRTINPLRAANTHLKVSHKRSSSLPTEDGSQTTNHETNHKRFASCDAEELISANSYQHEAQLYKQANVDWTKNRVKSNEGYKRQFDKEFFSSWSENNNPAQSIFENLSYYLDAEPTPATRKLSHPTCDDQLSIIESEASSVHTFFENDDRFEDLESHSYLYPYYTPSMQQSRRDEMGSEFTSVRMMLPPLHPQPPRKNRESYIILPMQSYEISTVCEVTFSSELTLLPSNSLTEITFETNVQQQPLSKKVSPIICEMSDSQYPPFYINSSTSLPHLHYITKSNPRMSYKQVYPRARNTTLPRAKREHRSPFQHMIPEEHDREHYKRLSSAPQSGNAYLSCDKSTGQLITPSLKRAPFKRGDIARNELSLRPSTSFTHIYPDSRSQPRCLKGSSSENCVRDEYTHPSPYVCHTAQDPSPAYIPQEVQTPYMNMDMFAPHEQEKYSELDGSEQTSITYKPPPRYFIPHPLGICCECTEYIYPSACQPIRIRSKMIHPDCFKCADCYSLLHVLSYQVLDGKFYCPRDFRRRITCHVCKVPIASYRGRESPVNIYNKFFHPTCYRCTSCSTQNHKLSFDGRWLLCLACAHARRQQIIKPASQEIHHRKSQITLL